MAETLTARSALDGHLPAGRHGWSDGPAGVVVSERRGVRLCSILARRGQVQNLVARGKALGLDVPTSPRRTTAESLALVWTGPGQWLALFGEGDADAVARRLASLADVCSLVAQDDARTVFGLSGPQARATLAKMLSIDLHPRAFRPGDAAVTLAGTIATTLWQVDETPLYEIAVPRSLARSFAGWLLESAAEFGCDIAELSPSLG